MAAGIVEDADLSVAPVRNDEGIAQKLDRFYIAWFRNIFAKANADPVGCEDFFFLCFDGIGRRIEPIGHAGSLLYWEGSVCNLGFKVHVHDEFSDIILYVEDVRIGIAI
jgi:hypothetical protein